MYVCLMVCSSIIYSPQCKVDAFLGVFGLDGLGILLLEVRLFTTFINV